MRKFIQGFTIVFSGENGDDDCVSMLIEKV